MAYIHEGLVSQFQETLSILEEGRRLFYALPCLFCPGPVKRVTSERETKRDGNLAKLVERGRRDDRC